MSEVVDHYEQLLGQHYTWSLGATFDELVETQRQLLDSCGAGLSEAKDGVDLSGAERGIGAAGGVALDLGCGSGIQSVALAQIGYHRVLSIDVSQTLISELMERAAGFPAIRPIQADVCAGLDSIVEPRSVTTAVCMGDTLPHLPDAAAVRRLLADTLDALVPGGMLILSFRDLSTPLTGLDRFIPVRADEDRIMTCFLEDEGPSVRVHDLVHNRDPDGSWRFNKSSYHKLRLSPDQIEAQLRELGFTETSVQPGPQGMVVITARRPDQSSG
jgi:SAM-dependent methyltransferase